MSDPNGYTYAYGYLDEALMRPPLVLGCERKPFVLTIGASAFITIVVFGLKLSGLFGGILLLIAGIILLRHIADYDPYFFATRREAWMIYPRHMPDVLPDRTLPRHLPFVGYDDPPSRAAVVLVRGIAALAVLAIAVALGMALALVL